MNDGIWITWELHRRNRGISQALSWNLCEIRIKKSIFFRFILSIYKTGKIIHSKRPKFVVAQNPSIVLSMITVFLRLFYKYVLIIDAHNSGIYPLEGKSKILMVISKFLQKSADITIVTNDSLKKIVDRNGGKAFVLPDKIPIVPEIEKRNLPGKFKIARISTFHDDEPYKNIIDSGNFISKDIHIYMTGNYKGKVQKNKLPENVKLLGYITEKEYWRLLSAVDGIIDLTRRENCLVCGAYEGLAVGKPLILSNTKTIKSYFSKGCIYVSTNSKDIAKGIMLLSGKKQNLEKEIKVLRKFLIYDWEDRLKLFKKEIEKVFQIKIKKKL